MGFSCSFSANNHRRRKPNCGLRKPTQNQRWVSSDQIRETHKSETDVLPKITKFWWERFKKKEKKKQHCGLNDTQKNGFCVREEIRLKAWRKAHKDEERRLQPECILLRKAKIWMKDYYFIFLFSFFWC